MSMTDIIDLGMLVLLSIFELSACLRYLSRLDGWRYRKCGSIAVFIVSVAANTVLMIVFREFTHSLVYLLPSGLVIFGMVYGLCQINITNAYYHTVIILLSTRFLRYVLGDILIGYTGDISYLNGADVGIRFLSGLGIFILFSISLGIVGKYTCKPHAKAIPIRRLITLSILAFALICLNDFVMEGLSPLYGYGNPRSFMTTMALFELICGFFGLIIGIGNESMLLSAERETELTQTRFLMREQLQQYKLQKETADRIAEYYHDLKKHINALKTLKSTDLRAEYLQELEADINKLNYVCKTGNETLDIVLTDTLFACEQKGISVQFSVDGTLLSFLALVDIVTIFGNALDNSIEAVEALPQDQREISVYSSKTGDWLVLRFENPCNKVLNEKNGMPVTTKKDAGFHGIGLTSIRHAVERYGGHLHWSVVNNRFILDILFLDP
ncbi:MAG: GHKL domain-containing protein [Bacilli bacterium]|nr:GHKL domain-containing protein [Bacilli bacterium]